MNRPAQIFKDLVSGGRGMICVAFHEPPPDHVHAELCNMLNGQGFDIQGRGRLYKFRCTNPHVSDVKITLARMALHRAGYERHDAEFPDQEAADECFGCRQPGHPNYI